MLNKKILAVAVALPMAFSGVAFADDVAGDDTHTIMIEVPEVNLLDVGATDDSATDHDPATAVSFVCAIDGADGAGANFDCGAAQSVTYAITANVASGGGTTRVINVSSTGTIDPTWSLTVYATPDAAVTGDNEGAAVHTAGAPLSITTGLGPTAVVQNIKNIASTGGAFTYNLGPADSSVAMAHEDPTGTPQVTMTYSVEEEA